MKKCFLLILIFPILVWSQEQPKVGLVLSGGGAKGFAHIGVLKEIEKSGLQIDYVGGTSMGAIIGGLYAAGYKASQIEEVIDKTDFVKLLQDEISRRDKPYFEKVNLEKHAFSLPVKNGSIGLPQGLSKGQNVVNLFTELLAPVDNITDFTKLPIPFYCMATDVETGEEIQLEKGSLPLALRASGSFPSLLNPVEIDGRLLIDGGVMNNFPVDKMKEKGADIIIGVSVEGKLLKRDKLQSITSILAQIINFQMRKKSDSQYKKLDFFIHPKVTDYSVVSFEDSDKIIEEGEKAAKTFGAVFDSISKLQKVRKQLPKISNLNQKFLIDDIVINGNKNFTNNYILGKLLLEKGDSVSYTDISKRINTLTATNNFERLDYHLNDSFKGKKLNITLKEEDIKSYLRLGLHYDLLYRSAVLLNYNQKNVFFRNDEFSLDLIVGDKIRYNFNYFLDDGAFGYGFSTRFNSFSSDIFLPANNLINKIDVNYRDFTTRLYAQTKLKRKFAFGFGLEHKNINTTSDTFLTRGETSIFDDSNYFNFIAFLGLDTFDKTFFPTSGFYANVDFTWFLWSDRNDMINTLALGSEEFVQFSKIDGRISFATTFFDKFTFQFTSDAGFFIGDEDSGVFDYRLGGYNQNFINNFYPFYGYDVAELTGKTFLRSEFDFRYKVCGKNYLTFLANYARVSNNILKNINIFEDTKQGYAVGYGLETILGPVQLQYSWSPGHKEKYWLFNLGFWF